ncbi:MAG: RNA polymerase sigma factor [Candidatus Weimeria sp.]
MSDSSIIHASFEASPDRDISDIPDNSALFEKIYRDYHLMIFRSAYLIAGNKADAEDIMQETFIAAFKNIGTLRKPESLKSWLFKIMTNTALSIVSRRSREVPVEDSPGTVESKTNHDTIGSVADDLIQNIYLKRCISELDSKCREVIILYYYSGFKIKEIAEILGCFEGTVKSRLNRGRKELKEKLKDSDDV